MRAPLLTSLLLLAAPLAAQDGVWLTDFAKAKAAAKEKKLPILAYFTGSDWNAYCKRMQAEVFAQKEFLDWAQKNVVLLEIDRPKDKVLDDATRKQNDELKVTYKITGFPAVVFLDAEGAVKGRIPGFVGGGPTAFITEASKHTWDAKGDDAAKPAGTKPQEGQPQEGDKKPADPSGQPAKEDKKDAAKDEQKSAWITSYADALARSKKEKKPILADFTGSDWCQYCIKLHDEVFTKPEFQKWAAANVILLELDYPKGKQQSEELKKQNEKLAKDFKIEGYPTVLVLDSTGKSRGKLGYQEGGAEPWVKAADKLVKKAKG